jgi:hypothetical protein
MKDETIVTDVSEEEQLSPRMKAMQSIVAERKQSEEPEEPEVIEEVEDVEESTIEEPEFVTVTVNGKEKQVEAKKVEEAGGITTYQKMVAADEKLRNAAARESELARREAELARMEASLLEKKKEPEVDPDDIGREFAEALYEDEEKVAKTVTGILKKLGDVEKTVKEVHDKETQRELKSREDVVKYYHQTYNDISSDLDMHPALNRRLAELANSGESLTPQQMIDKAAAEVYAKFGINREDPDATTKKPTPQEVKEKLPTQPRKASTRKAPPPKQEPKKRSDTIAEMRNSRGVHSY